MNKMLLVGVFLTTIGLVLGIGIILQQNQFNEIDLLGQAANSQNSFCNDADSTALTPEQVPSYVLFEKQYQSSLSIAFDKCSEQSAKTVLEATCLNGLVKYVEKNCNKSFPFNECNLKSVPNPLFDSVNPESPEFIQTAGCTT